jgi:hypothetical protein
VHAEGAFQLLHLLGHRGLCGFLAAGPCTLPATLLERMHSSFRTTPNPIAGVRDPSNPVT